MSTIFEDVFRSSDILSILTFAIVIYAIMFAYLFYGRAQRQKRRSVTLKYINRWNDLGYQTIFSRLYREQSLRNEKISNVITERAGSNDYFESLQDMERVWNFFEELSIAIIYREADEEMAREFFFYSVITTYRLSDKAFYTLKEKYRNKALYSNFERLFGRWTTKDYPTRRRVL